MYDLGDYPGVVLAPGGARIRAELYRIAQPAILRALDDFELYRPAEPRPYDEETGRGSLYLREAIAVGGVLAWVYLWNGHSRGARPISSGDWKTWLKFRTLGEPGTSPGVSRMQTH